MGLEYKKILLQNVIDCMGMGLDDKTDVIEQAIEWTIDDCMNELAKQLEDYVQTEEFSRRWEKVK
tara:strand:+ start:278 stop:472 length:195 start_codon:yes stop_codon:yes gene_type:complete